VSIYQPGVKWEAKSGDRVIRIVRETSKWRGERQFQVLNLENRREFDIGINGLSRKYRPVACSIPPGEAS
jgi:hypothetical protein